jgi:RNA polymerase sigma-70 factor (ECF subfamily)
LNKKIEGIFHQFYSPLCNYAVKMVHDEHAAEDIVQTLFIQLFEKNNLNTVDNIEGYLLRSIRFKCIDHIRKMKRLVSLPINEITEDSVIQHEITEEEIEPLFHYYAAKLPPRIREVFLLSRVSKLSYKEIAEELNVSQKTVENQMGSALKKLRTILHDEHLYLLSLMA